MLATMSEHGIIFLNPTHTWPVFGRIVSNDSNSKFKTSITFFNTDFLIKLFITHLSLLSENTTYTIHV